MTKTAETAVCACRHKRIEHFEEQPYGCSIEDCLCEGFSHETASQIMTDAAVPRQTIKPDLQPTRGALNAASAILKQRWNPWNQSAKPAIAAIVSRETCDEELLSALEYMNNFYLSNSHKRSCQADPDPQRCPHCKAEAAMKKARGQQ